MHHPQILIIFLILNWPGLAPGDSSPGNWWRLTLCPRHLIKYGNSPPLLLAPVCCVWERMMNRCQRGSCDVGMVSGQAIVSCPPQFTIQVYENKVDIKVEKFSLILWNKNFHNLILANLFLDSRAMNMNQFLIWTHDCLSWSLAGILLIHDGVLLYWIVSVPLYYPPLPPSPSVHNNFTTISLSAGPGV